MDKQWLIIFDMDGTLYDLSDVMDVVYETQISFLQERMGWTRTEVIQFFRDNNIEPQVSQKSKSATELFNRLGFGRQEWTEYRQKCFPVEKINPLKAVKADLLERFARLGDIVLLTSNTTLVCERILERIGITPLTFRKIVCSDTESVEMPFNKFFEMKKLMESGSCKALLSIGDRYQTDIVPALELGGSGCLVRNCSSLETIYRDMESGHLGNCSEYEFFAKEERR